MDAVVRKLSIAVQYVVGRLICKVSSHSECNVFS
jgi:hypothetical protein